MDMCKGEIKMRPRERYYNGIIGTGGQSAVAPIQIKRWRTEISLGPTLTAGFALSDKIAPGL